MAGRAYLGLAAGLLSLIGTLKMYGQNADSVMVGTYRLPATWDTEIRTFMGAWKRGANDVLIGYTSKEPGYEIDFSSGFDPASIKAADELEVIKTQVDVSPANGAVSKKEMDAYRSENADGLMERQRGSLQKRSKGG